MQRVFPSSMTKEGLSHRARGTHAINCPIRSTAVTHLSPAEVVALPAVAPETKLPRFSLPPSPRQDTHKHSQEVGKAQAPNDTIVHLLLHHLTPHVSCKNKSKRGRNTIPEQLLKSELCSILRGRGTGRCRYGPDDRSGPRPRNTAPH